MQQAFISSTDLKRNLSCSHCLGSWLVMLHHKLYFWECLFSSPNSTTIQFYNQPTLHQKPFLNTNMPIQHTQNISDTHRLSPYYGIGGALSHTCITDLCLCPTYESWCLLNMWHRNGCDSAVDPGFTSCPMNDAQSSKCKGKYLYSFSLA